MHLAATERDDRPPGRQKPGVQGGGALRRAVLQASGASADRCGLGSFEASSGFGRSRACRGPSGRGGELRTQIVVARLGASCGTWRRMPGVRVAWFPALRPTRLETRTKELCTRASHWAPSNPNGAAKAKRA